MTPKEKANSIYNSMVVDFKIDKWQSKQCALSAVNLVIPIVAGYEDALSASQKSDDLEYWNEVKKEIENI